MGINGTKQISIQVRFLAPNTDTNWGRSLSLGGARYRSHRALTVVAFRAEACLAIVAAVRANLRRTSDCQNCGLEGPGGSTWASGD